MVDFSKLSSVNDVRARAEPLIQAAQVIYDEWSQDENGYDEVFGAGGICEAIASEMVSCLNQEGLRFLSNQEGSDEHADVTLLLADGVYRLDIPASIYEIHLGIYRWKKKDGVFFQPSDIEIDLLSANPEDYELYGIERSEVEQELNEDCPSI